MFRSLAALALALSSQASQATTRLPATAATPEHTEDAADGSQHGGSAGLARRLPTDTLARAEDAVGAGFWRLAVSPYAFHFRYSAEHRAVYAIGLERQRDDQWLAGASYFRNSFGQPSAYAYVGKRFPALWGQPQLFGQASIGLLYGYKGQFQRKVPLNYNGFAPGALLSLGWTIDRHSSVQAHLLGDAGMMFQLSYDLR